MLREVQREVLEAQDRQDVPFEKVVEAVQPKRDVSRNPIFQVLVNYVNTGSRRPLTLGLCRMEEMGFDYYISKFDLYFNFVAQPTGCLPMLRSPPPAGRCSIANGNSCCRSPTTARVEPM